MKEFYQNMPLSLLYDKWFRSYVPKKSGYLLVYRGFTAYIKYVCC